MWIHIVIQLLVIGLFIMLGWLISYKKKYHLISGFTNRSHQEQDQLIANGYPQKTGVLLILTGIGMLILFPLSFTAFLYKIEVQYGFMLIFLLVGLIYISKFEVKEKRKRSYWTSTILSVTVIGFIMILLFIGYKPNELLIQEDTLEITGMYGEVWRREDIDEIKLIDEMPPIKLKVNGFGFANISKGYFQVENYGKSLLFIKKESPYLYLRINNRPVFINGNNPSETKAWYRILTSD